MPTAAHLAESPKTDEVEDLADEVFELLKMRGPLCASQISIELVVSLKKVNRALGILMAREVVALRPDHDTSRQYSKEEIPWGIPEPVRKPA